MAEIKFSCSSCKGAFRIINLKLAGNFLTTFCAIHLSFLCGHAQDSNSITIEIGADQKHRKAAIVSFALPEKWRNVRHFELVSLTTNEKIPNQVAGRSILWIDRLKLEAGKSRRYQLTPAPEQSAKVKFVACKKTKKGLTIQIGNKPVFHYNTAVIACPGKDNSAYNRSGFIHPLYDPAGRCVTDDFPPDHLHQHGIMFPWVDTTFENRHVDFWNQGKKLGTVEHVKVLHKVDGPVFAEFTVKLRHMDLKANKAALNETWTVRVYNLAEFFVFDMESVQTCAGKSPLHINKYHYGGMAIRGTRDWFKKGACEFLTSEGKTRKNGNHTRPRWVDIFGTIAGKKSGVAIFCHPKNFRFPQPVRLHPSKPYFCWAPEFLGRFSIVPGKRYESKYRFVIHTGAPDREVLEGIWNDYANPLTARIVP